MSPFKGFCLTCNEHINAETKEDFGNALIEHHNERDKAVGGIISRCNLFQCSETDSGGKVIGHPFGLETTMEIVSQAWTEVLWYQKRIDKERE